MNTDKLKEKLIAAARNTPPDDRVPYAFEKRIMARLQAQPAPDAAALWARALWRAAVPCVAITVLLGAVSLLPVAKSDTAESQDFSDNYEQAMLASAEQQEELW